MSDVWNNKFYTSVTVGGFATTRQWFVYPQTALLALFALDGVGWEPYRIFVQSSKKRWSAFQQWLSSQLWHAWISIQCTSTCTMYSEARFGVVFHKSMQGPQIPWWRIGWRLGKIMKKNFVAFVKVSMRFWWQVAHQQLTCQRTLSAKYGSEFYHRSILICTKLFQKDGRG